MKAMSEEKFVFYTEEEVKKLCNRYFLWGMLVGAAGLMAISVLWLKYLGEM
jgi:hypothetical protein